MKMFQVDAFTDHLFRGNPAAVLVLDNWLPDALMLAIAQENNLAETAFVKALPDGAWDLRWFAPAHEVDFCGHATLAAAHVLFSKSPSIALLLFHTRIGELRVSKVANGYRLDVPCLSPEFIETLPEEIVGIFAEPPNCIFRNFENIFVDLGSADAVRNFTPDLTAIARRLTLFCSRCRYSGRPGHGIDPCNAYALLGIAVGADEAKGISGVRTWWLDRL